MQIKNVSVKIKFLIVKIMRLETAHEPVQAGKSTPSEKNKDNNKEQNNGDHHPSSDKMIKKPKAPDLRVPQPISCKYMNYTDLVASQEGVFLAAEQSRVFKWPNLLRGDHSKRNQKQYCQFHRDIDHTTKEFITLKDEIEKRIRRGYLQDYVNNRRARPLNDRLEEREAPLGIRTVFG